MELDLSLCLGSGLNRMQKFGRSLNWKYALGSYVFGHVSCPTWYCLLERERERANGSILGYSMYLHSLTYPPFSCDGSCILMVISTVTDKPSYHHKDTKAHLWACDRCGDQASRWAESSTSCYGSHRRSLYLFGTSLKTIIYHMCAMTSTVTHRDILNAQLMVHYFLCYNDNRSLLLL